ncbi:MAG: hypothetical protein Q9157_002619 [Trypethelium eluteriae]
MSNMRPLCSSRSGNLWDRAADSLTDQERHDIDVYRSDKLEVLSDLNNASRKRWTYRGKNGRTVVLRDVFNKIVKWIDIFKQIGDTAVQYDPVHAALPWAGIRFVLQIAINDHRKFADVIENLAWIGELVCHNTVVENLYLGHPSEAASELERALLELYTRILTYLAQAKHYPEEDSTGIQFPQKLGNNRGD